MASLQLLLSPYDISWSRNPISFRWRITPYLEQERAYNTQLRLTLYVESEHYNAEWSEVKSVQVRPDASGYVDYDFSKLLDAQLEYDFPALDGNVQWCRKQIRRFRIRYALVDDYGQAQDAVETDSFNVIKGGLSAAKWHRDKYFKDYLTAPRFLTWMQSSNDQQMMQDFQNEHLYFLVPTYRQNGFNVARGVSFDDGSWAYSTLLPTSYPDPTMYSWQLFSMRNGALYNSVPVPAGKTITALRSIVTLNQTIAKFSAIDILPKIDDTRTLMWRNSLGGMDTHVFTGLLENSLLVQKEAATRLDAVQFFQSATERPDEYYVNVKHWNKRKLNSGWINRLTIDNMRDLLRSGFAYEMRGGQWFPVKIDGATTALYTNRDGLYSLSVETYDAIAENSYTPEEYAPVADTNPQVAYLSAEQLKPTYAQLTWRLPVGYTEIELQYSPVAGSSMFSQTYKPGKGVLSLGVKMAASLLVNYPYTTDTYWRARIILSKDSAGNTVTAGGWSAWQNLLVRNFMAPIARTARFTTVAGQVTGGSTQRVVGQIADFQNIATPVNSSNKNALFPNVQAASGGVGNGSAGGYFLFNGVGELLYTPPSPTFAGVDSIDYTLVEIVAASPFFGVSPAASDRIILTVTDPTGNSQNAPVNGLPYVKLETANPSSTFTPPDWYTEGGNPLQQNDRRICKYVEVYVSFWKDAACITPMDLTGAGISISVQNDMVGNNGVTYCTDTLQALATGSKVGMGTALVEVLEMFSLTKMGEGKTKILPSAFYITV